MKYVYLLAIYLVLTSCNTTCFRAITRGDSCVTDYTYFPAREIQRSESVLDFPVNPSAAIQQSLYAALDEGDRSNFMRKTKTNALIVIHDGTVVFERYGEDFTRESIVTSFSISKSFISAMIGTLIDEGTLRSVHQPITDFIPELSARDSRFQDIEIEDLLSMSSGISYNETHFLFGDDTKTYYSPDLRSLATQHTTISEMPGAHFHYNNYNPLLLGIIIERATRGSVSAYVSRSIWSRIGSESDATWSLDSETSGFEKMESGINARAIDFARFGYLYCNNGVINNRRIISAEWIRASLEDTHEQNREYYDDTFGHDIQNAKCGGYYGLSWYIVKRPDSVHNDFFAAGKNSQILYISPDANLVIARFGDEDGIPFWKWISAFNNLASGILGKNTDPARKAAQ